MGTAQNAKATLSWAIILRCRIKRIKRAVTYTVIAGTASIVPPVFNLRRLRNTGRSNNLLHEADNEWNRTTDLSGER